MPPLVLASASPRRRQLLAAAGYAFDLDPADVDESDYPPSLDPAAIAELLADRKARAVAARRPGAIILAADTVVGLERRMLGKPADAADAKRILAALSGTRHETITAVRVFSQSPPVDLARTVRSSVFMRRLTDAELDAYIQSGLWEGKAGAYGIQDNDPFVTRIEGSLTNIVGLPMEETAELLTASGIARLDPAARS